MSKQNNEKIKLDPWPFRLSQGAYGELGHWKEQLQKQVSEASSLGESGKVFLHLLTVFDIKSTFRYLKPLKEPISSEEAEDLDKESLKRYEVIPLDSYVQPAIDEKLTSLSLKLKVNQSEVHKAEAELLATAVIRGGELEWEDNVSFKDNAETPIKKDMSLANRSVNVTLKPEEMAQLQEMLREQILERAAELRLQDLCEKMTEWQAADSWLRAIMLKGIDVDPSGQLQRCKTAFDSNT